MIRRPPRSTLFPYHDALPISRTAGLAAERPRTSRGGDDAVYHRRRDGGQVALAKFPFLAHQSRSEEHTSELQSPCNLVCRLLLEKKKKRRNNKVPVCKH